MKKILSVLLIIALMFSLVACGKSDEEDEDFYDDSSIETDSDDKNAEPIAITIKELTDMTKPAALMKVSGGATLQFVYDNPGTGATDITSENVSYAGSEKAPIYSQVINYGNGTVTKVFYDGGYADNSIYFLSGDTVVKQDASKSTVDSIFNESLLALEYYNSNIVNATEVNGVVTADVECKSGDSLVKKYTVVVNQNKNRIDAISEEIINDDGTTSKVSVAIKYSAYTAIDDSPRRMLLEREEERLRQEAAEKEAAEKAEQEAKERAEREAKERAEREAREREERERQARENAESGDSGSQGGSQPETPPETPVETPPAAPPPVVNQTYGSVSFDTVDVYGNPVDNSLISGAKVVLVNMWESWCGPCRSELPDLQKLYSDYQGRGLVIIGAYSSSSYDSDVVDIINSVGITYPIIKTNSSINTQATGYVPTTFITDGNGNILTSEPYIGSRSYSSWERIILQYLN